VNVYLFELRRSLKSAAVWTAVLLAAVIVLIAAFYPVYYNSRADLEAILAGFPPEFSAAFGLAVNDIFSFGGFYAFCFLYLSLMGAVMAASLGLQIFAREKQGRCTDFLLTKPRSRFVLFFAKLLAALTLLVASNAFFLPVLAALYAAYGHGEASMGRVVLAASALFFTELVMLAAAVAAAIFARRIRSVSGTATAIGFAGFILTALHSILKEDALRYITPYKYFDPAMAFSAGHFEPRYAAAAALATVLLLAAALTRYCSADTRAL